MTAVGLGHRPGLDSLRGVAVLMVVAAHSIARPEVAGAGGIGVVVFFVLSGYLITTLLLEERSSSGTIDVRRFYARRARRLFPALGLALVLCAAANYRNGLWIARPLLSSLTYTANFSSAGHDFEFGSFSHLWSLAVEEHFYMVWPVVMLCLTRRWLWTVCAAGIVVVSLVRWGVSFHNPSLAYRGTHLRIDAMLIGAVLAFVGLRWRPSRGVVVAAALLLALMSHEAVEEQVVRLWLIPVALASAVLVASAVHWRRIGWLSHVGAISYGVYLYHLPLVTFVWRAGITGPVSFPVGVLLISLLVAEASYRWVEMPIRRGRRSCAVPQMAKRTGAAL